MEQLNKVELRGIVGNVKEIQVGNQTHVRLSVATNYVYKSKDGEVIIETTWHAVEKFFPESPGIQKCDSVEVKGRLRTQRYTTSNGSEITVVLIIAESITKLDVSLTMAVG